MKIDKTVMVLAVIVVAIGLVFVAIFNGSTLDAIGYAGLEKKVQKLAADQLRDPSSAQFRNTKRYGSYICGEINGKNGFGAYNGFVRFYGDENSASIDPSDYQRIIPNLPSESEQFEKYYKISCS